MEKPEQSGSVSEYGFRSGQVAVDLMAYDKYLSSSDMTEEERRAFLEAMWCVIVTLMRLGYRIPDQDGYARKAA